MNRTPTFQIVGLTGGIGSGKSTVATLFRQLKITVVSADQIIRDLLQTDPSVRAAIINHFGPDFLNEQGEVQRGKLKDRIFTVPADRVWLENLLHPLVKQEIHTLRTAVPVGEYCIVEIPLLVETQFETAVDSVLVVDCPETIQIARVTRRDGLTVAQARQILLTQATRTERLAKADDIISNTGSMADLATATFALQQKYHLLATASVAKS